MMSNMLNDAATLYREARARNAPPQELAKLRRALAQRLKVGV
jgi:hypothetical protein